MFYMSKYLYCILFDCLEVCRRIFEQQQFEMICANLGNIGGGFLQIETLLVFFQTFSAMFDFLGIVFDAFLTFVDLEYESLGYTVSILIMIMI